MASYSHVFIVVGGIHSNSASPTTTTAKQIERYQRCTNTLRRVLETLGLERRARDVTAESDQRRVNRIADEMDQIDGNPDIVLWSSSI